MISSDIYGFAWIGSQIVQLIAPILIIMDQLPVPLPDDGGRIPSLVPVMRVMPVQRPFRDVTTGQKWYQADTVDMLLRPKVRPHQLQQGRIKVRSGNRDIAGAARRDQPWDLDEIRFPYASFPLVAFTSSQGQVRSREIIPG